MQVVGTVSKDDLLEMKRRGVAPETAVQAILSEARRRNPGAASLILQKNMAGGFHIVAL